jgi:DNA-binding transcriptional MerR regulator
MITIGIAASRSAVTADTIRFYERKGLLRPARKTAAGYRLYDDDALRRIRFIKKSQTCGFSLEEIGELLALRRVDRGCCREVRTVAVKKKLEIERRIRSLRAMSTALSQLVAICNDESRPIDECPILGALEAANSKIRHQRAKVDGNRPATR